VVVGVVVFEEELVLPSSPDVVAAVVMVLLVYILGKEQIMKYAVINKGLVENIIVSEPDTAAQHNNWIPLNDNQWVNIGFLYANGMFSEPIVSDVYKWMVIRQQRDLLLKESDQLMIPDRFNLFTNDEKSQILDYRKKLRDIPQDYMDPDSVKWPLDPLVYKKVTVEEQEVEIVVVESILENPPGSS
jgi:hypothetical protein